ncbi:alpha/beta hydrolase, partial [Bifidobacterium mongoliense]|uniref:alpha/beta hydrolase n=1 Tax=Bifidobacterium mongoliense TaxID=518643 RepID=UPI002647402E
MKRIRRIVAWVLAVVLGVALVVGAAFVVSPVPSIMLFRNAFKEGHPVEPPRFDEVRRTVQVTRDQEYPSSYRRHTFDLYRPRRIPAHAALPVIVWVHGGGFIAGDKSGLSTYATLMAARGYAVIAMNYDYAPTGTYPTPVVQLGQMVSHVAAIAQRERLDPDRIVVGGDSAGAQIAAQFAAVQTTPGYAESSGIERIAMRAPLAGALLFCGPYDFTRFTDANAPWIQRWFMTTIGWGLLGTRDWASSPQMRQASVV